MEDGLLQAEQFTEEMFEEAWRAAEAELHDMTSGDSNAASAADNLFAQQGLGMTAPPTDFLSSIRTSEGQQVGPFDEPPIWGPGVSQISEYVFAAENPYLERYNGGGSSAPELSPMELALQLIREGKDQEAILVLEVEVQRDAENSEAWSLLGQLYANLDQDLEAIKCLVKAHEADPYMFLVSGVVLLGRNKIKCGEVADRSRAWSASWNDRTRSEDVKILST